MKATPPRSEGVTLREWLLLVLLLFLIIGGFFLWERQQFVGAVFAALGTTEQRMQSFEKRLQECEQHASSSRSE